MPASGLRMITTNIKIHIDQREASKYRWRVLSLQLNIKISRKYEISCIKNDPRKLFRTEFYKFGEHFRICLFAPLRKRISAKKSNKRPKSDQYCAKTTIHTHTYTQIIVRRTQSKQRAPAWTHICAGRRRYKRRREECTSWCVG